MALRNDTLLDHYRINLEIGRVKNPNKNPVAEKAIGELEDELLKQDPKGDPVTQLGLATAVARLNSRIRNGGLSAREMYTQRNQFTHEQLPIADRNIITLKQEQRESNHNSSALSKSHGRKPKNGQSLSVGDLVYLYSDRDKTKARPRYIVVSITDGWCYIKKFTGNQLRANSYKVKTSECYRIPSETKIIKPQRTLSPNDDYDTDDGVVTKYDHDSDRSPGDTSVVGTPNYHETQNFKPLPDNNTVPSHIPEVLSTTPPSDDSETLDNSLKPTDDIITPSRPQRTKKPPSYLKDYVLYD
jgi:hypothetical protein